MIQVNLLKGIIASKGLSQRRLAIQMNMTDKTFYAKMKRGIFNSDEIGMMIKILEIQNPMEIFFANDVT